MRATVAARTSTNQSRGRSHLLRNCYSWRARILSEPEALVLVPFRGGVRGETHAHLFFDPAHPRRDAQRVLATAALGTVAALVLLVRVQANEDGQTAAGDDVRSALVAGAGLRATREAVEVSDVALIHAD